uniref:Protein preY, mitochondrial n=1 Tax=Canis lupus dingo TaxID=286419 RepID=A0A8C0JM28_CANLU
MQGAQCETRSQVSRIMPGAQGRRLTAEPPRHPYKQCFLSTHRSFCFSKMEDPSRAFDLVLLEFLVCLLSKKPLRYEASTTELINDKLEIAFPIINGDPNMILQATRMTHQNKKKKWEEIKQHPLEQ